MEGSLPEADQPLPIFPWHVETISVWRATWRQWRWLVGLNSAVRQGMDWQQVESALRLMGVKRKRWPTIHAGLKVMEEEALNALEQINKGAH